MVNVIVDKSAKILTAVAALNWGTSQFLNFNVLNYLGSVWAKVAILAITASGAYVAYLLYKKKI